MTRRILLVDDEPDISDVIQKALSLYGFEVDAYNDAEEALSKFDVGRYDLLLLDYNMPSINGFDLYERMKRIDNKVRACFLTGDSASLEEGMKQSSEQNSRCYIHKPIRMNSLASQLHRILEE